MSVNLNLILMMVHIHCVDHLIFAMMEFCDLLKIYYYIQGVANSVYIMNIFRLAKIMFHEGCECLTDNVNNIFRS
jgi:hypothetical protein